MKKLTSLLLAALLLASASALSSCNKQTADDGNQNDVANNGANTENTDDKTDDKSNDQTEDKTDQNAGDLAYIKEKGDWIGFDADVAKAFAESLGVKAKFVEIEWGNKILELNAKSIDCVWNGMTLTDEVLSSMECSDAYCNNQQIVIVPADKADDYKTEESLKDLTFAVEAGSAGEEVATEKGFGTTPVLDQATAVMEVASGTSDAAIIDSLMAAAMVGEGTGYPQLAYTVGLTTEEYGVGFRKGSDAASALNDFFKASKEDGTLEKIAETYGVQAALIK